MDNDSNTKMSDIESRNDIVISLRNISKKYKLYSRNRHRLFEALHPFRKKYHTDFYALQDINLDIRRGEVLGIVGRNGSGKSTLLKLISGVLLPNTGTIEVKGKVSALLELGSGLNPDFTGRENIFFIGQLMGYSKKEMSARADDIIEFSEIEEHIDQPVRTYSSGMRARLAFGINTSIDPDILILDEVLSVGDALFQRKAFSRMGNLIKNDRTTVLFVSHNEHSVAQICTKAILLNSGILLYQASPKNVIKSYQQLLFASKSEMHSIVNRLLKSNDINESNNLKNIGVIDERAKKSNSYVDTLYSKSMNILRDGLNKITSISIHNKSGDQVNYIMNNDELIVRLRILIESPGHFAVSFTFRGTKGEILSGVSYAGRKIITHYFDTGEHYMEFPFRNVLLKGIYYLSASLFDSDGKNIYAVSDLCVIKVAYCDERVVGVFNIFSEKIPNSINSVKI